MNALSGRLLGYIAVLILSLGTFIFGGYTFSALILLGAILYGVLAAATCLLSGRGLGFEIASPGEVEKGEAFRAGVIVRNKSFLPVMRCNLKIALRNMLTGREEDMVISDGILPKGESRLELKGLSDRTGLLILSLKEAWVSDPIGIFRRTLNLEDASSETVVLPETERVLLDDEDLERYDMESFKYAEGKVGSDSSETVGIREYIQGDSIKGIHWKLTAKTGDIMVKEYGLPVDTKLMVIVDKKMPSSPDDEEAAIESITEFGLSISRTLMEKGISQEFGWFDIDKDGFERRTITKGDDYRGIYRDYLAAKCFSHGPDTAESFLESEGKKDFAGFIYASLEADITSGVNKLKEYGNVAIYTPR